MNESINFFKEAPMSPELLKATKQMDEAMERLAREGFSKENNNEK